MEDIFRRLGNVEVSVADLRTQVGIIVGTMPHLATAAALSDVKSQVSAVAAAMPHLATNAAVSEISAIILSFCRLRLEKLPDALHSATITVSSSLANTSTCFRSDSAPFRSISIVNFRPELISG